MKTAATQKDRFMRLKLKSLADAGVNGEKTNALEALAKLEARLDFDAAIEEDAGDLFAGIHITPCRSGESHCLLEFEPQDSDIAAFVKWTLENRFSIRGSFRAIDNRQTIWIEARAFDMPALVKLAEGIRSDFAKLWDDFRQLTASTAGARKPFVMGLYDGLMNETRPAGQMLPPVRVAPLGKAKRKAVAAAPGVAIHPYSIALDLGHRIRVSTPVTTVAREMETTLRAALAA